MSTSKLEGPIPGDPFLVVGSVDLAAAGYVGEEWFLSGTARSYSMSAERSTDGRWDATPADPLPFRTRIVVRRPASAERFNGTVVVEWMNVSGGLDAAPDWLFLHRHLLREGAAWVGVSAQKAGIDGGGLVPGLPLKQANAERYGQLEHPGDAFAFDIFSEVARSLRTPGSGPLGPLEAQRILAVGESQSAGFLVTYVNAVDPLAQCFDAFLIHGRPGIAAGIDGHYLRARADGELSDVAIVLDDGHRIREDVRVPVLTLQSETDIVTLGGGRARQSDSDNFRWWELAGASHFDTYGLVATHVDGEGVDVAELAEKLAPTRTPLGLEADVPMNSGPQQHYVLNAALSHLERWTRDGTPPPRAPRLESSDPVGSKLHRSALGIVNGGIRTPWVDVPSAALTGDSPGGEGFLFLFGQTLPFDADTLAKLYPGGAAEHRRDFEASARQAVEDGFLLAADLEEICALAEHGRQPSGWRSD